MRQFFFKKNMVGNEEQKNSLIYLRAVKSICEDINVGIKIGNSILKNKISIKV